MRQRNNGRIYLFVSVLALAVLVLGAAGLARAQNATPEAGVDPTVVVTAPATDDDNQANTTPTAGTNEATAPPPAETETAATGEPSPSPSSDVSPSPSPSPAPTPSPSPSLAPATPAGAPRVMADIQSVVPTMAVSDFSAVSSTFDFGYPTVTTTATIVLSAPGPVANIGNWQITLLGDTAHPLAYRKDQNTTVYMSFSQVTYQGLAAPVAGVTAANVGQALSDWAAATPVLIAEGGSAGFAAGTPSQLAFAITLAIAPTWADPPGNYSGQLILSITGSPPASP